jgi:anti-sigma B factor antagonist
VKINFNKTENNLFINLEGRLDTITAPELEGFITSNINGVSELSIDCEKLDYVSSAGLRVLLSAHKKMNGALKLTNVKESVMEVFEITGFADILVIC